MTKLTDFRQARQLPIEGLIAAAEAGPIQDLGHKDKPRTSRTWRLTRRDGASAAIVDVYKSEFRPQKRW